MTLPERRIIKFSHDYKKLPLVWEGTQATLIHILKTDYWHLRNAFPQFVKYDTQYRGEPGCYELPKEGPCFVLFLLHSNSGQPFTTIRDWTQEKENNYKAGINESWILIKT